jgi:hypothetical protein
MNMVCFFALGHTVPSRVERFDLEQRNFREEEFSTAPYTYIIADTMLQICAIAAKTRLAQKPIGIEVPQLNDPVDFITYLDTAYSIMKYTIFLV